MNISKTECDFTLTLTGCHNNMTYTLCIRIYMQVKFLVDDVLMRRLSNKQCCTPPFFLNGGGVVKIYGGVIGVRSRDFAD